MNLIEYVCSGLCKIKSENVTLVDITDALETNRIVLHNLLVKCPTDVQGIDINICIINLVILDNFINHKCTVVLYMGLVKPKLHVRGTKNIMILKQDQVIQDLT